MATQHIAAVTVLLAAAVVAVNADTIYVDANCPGGDGSELDPYCSIQTAIDNAVDTDEIVVAPGTYLETINFLGKAITLRSSGGAEVTTIDAQQSGFTVLCEGGEGANTVLEGFAITGGLGSGMFGAGGFCGGISVTGGGMMNASSSPTVTNCIFTGNVVSVRDVGCITCCVRIGGAMVNFNSSPTVTNCTFSHNVVDATCVTQLGPIPCGYGGGMRNSGFSSPTVINCTFSDNTANFGGGMASVISTGNSSPTMIDCTFSGNSANFDGGGMFNVSSSPTVTDCTFAENSAGSGGGMYNSSGSSPTMSNCTYSGNTSRQGGGMYNDNSSPTLTGCNFESNVAAAMFSTTFGGGMANMNSNPNVTDCSFTGNMANEGGGMSNGGSSPTLTNCTFEGNTAGSGGGLYNANSNPAVTGCLFSGNGKFVTVYGGGMYNTESSPTVLGCTFVGNESWGEGGGMYNAHSSPTVAGCTFNENTGFGGGGMYNFGDLGSPIVTACIFTGNTVESNGGGMENIGGSPTVTNCSFIANTATSGGGGMSNFSGEFSTVGLTMSNCTYSGNTAPSGRAVRFDSSQEPNTSYLTMANCILLDGADEIASNVISDLSVSYSCVQGGFPGTGNIDADPLFVDPDEGDFGLSAGSPCIDAGNNWGVAPDFADQDADGDTLELTPLDLDGNPRFSGDDNDMDPGCGVPVVVDMGAYERPGASFEVMFGDLNGNGTVGALDLMILNGCIGSDDPDCCIADLDLDGEVAMSDRMIMWSTMIEFSP